MSEPTAVGQDLTERIRAFQQSRVLLTAIELDVFGAIGNGATVVEVTRRVGADPRATEMLLNALAALGVIEKSKGVFRNTARPPSSSVEKRGWRCCTPFTCGRGGPR